MAATIRQTITPFKLRVLETLKVQWSMPEDRQNKEDMAAYVEQLGLHLNKLSNHNAALKQKLTEWEQKLDKKSKLQKEEMALFQQMASDSEGAMQVSWRAEDRIEELKVLLDKVEKLMEKKQSSKAMDNEYKLHKIKIPPFTNNRRDWPRFWAAFEAAVHNQVSMSHQAKLLHLESLLTGEALKIVTEYSGRGDCYELAINDLLKRFGDENELVRQLVNELLDLPDPVNNKEICAFVDELEGILKQLGNAKIDTENKVLEVIITRKLSQQLAAKVVEEQQRSSHWSVGQLRKVLVNYADCIRQVDVQKSFQQSNRNVTNEQVGKQKEQSHENKARKDNRFVMFRSCPLCKDDHQPEQCRVFPSPQEKLARANFLHLCLNCLKAGHTKNQCWKKSPKCDKCGKEHFTFMCVRTNAVSPERQPQLKQNVLACDVVRESSNALIGISVEAVNPLNTNLTKRVIMLLDSGSQKSFITEDLASELQLKTKKQEKLRILSFASKHPNEKQSNIVELGLRLVTGAIKKIYLNTIDIISNDVILCKGDAKENQTICEKPNILIGINYFFSVVTNLETSNTEGAALMTIFGKIQVPQQNELQSRNIKQFCATTLEEFWELENIGITDPTIDEDHLQAMIKFQNTLKTNSSGRYIVPFPWKDENLQLSDNFNLCLGRLRSNFNKLKNCQEALDEYQKALSEYLQNGIIEKVNHDQKPKRCFYLPHMAVVRDGKSTRTRIVFDASAHCTKGVSLNDALLKGPVYLPDIVGIMLRFRSNKYVLLADIEKAFLQMELEENDRDLTRFLWIKDSNKPLQKDNIQIYRFCRVPFGVISSPFLLMSVLKYHLSRYESYIASELAKNLYVDNVLISGDDLVQARSWYKESKQIFKDAHMNLRQYVTNNEEIEQTVEEADKVHEKITSVLGIKWDTGIDSIIIQTRLWRDEIKTKRQLLRFIAQQYDPLGMLAPVVLPWKALYQKTWSAKLGWDETLKGELAEKLEELKNTWSTKEFKLRRLLASNSIRSLHAMVDASGTAYAAVLYGISELEDNSLETELIFAKARIMPLKGMTIPKAELMAVLIGARSLLFVKREMKLDIPMYIWSDSMCVINWIKNNKDSLPRFVKNRVTEIVKGGFTIKYVPSQANIADLASRGTSIDQFLQRTDWFEGPQWLKQQGAWPTQPPITSTSSQNFTFCSPQDEMYSVNTSQANGITPIVDVSRFSTFTKLKGTVEKVLTFLQAFKVLHHRPLFTPSYSSNQCGTRELAEQLLIKSAQSTLASTDTSKCGLIKDENGIWRVGARLLNLKQEHPVMLPNKHRLTTLIVLHEHKAGHHCGVSQTLNLVRKKFWFEKGRSTVKAIIKRECFLCRKLCSLPFSLPPLAQLPPERVYPFFPFQNTAVDMAGPFLVKENTKKRVKRWIYLFTCLSTRASHIEVVKNQSTKEFIYAFNRFKARRGTPASMYSDNAKAFKVAKCVDNMQWKFCVPLAPWQGGVYERLIGLFKTAFARAIGNRSITADEFQDIVVSIEATLNSRPLTQVADDSFQVITPNDFLNPQSKNEVHLSYNYDLLSKDMAQVLKECLTATRKTLSSYWCAWKTSYLNCLRERYNKEIKQGKKRVRRTPQVGEVVLISDEQKSKLEWKLGIVRELHMEDGDIVRSVSILMPNHHVLRRPLNRVYPLELNSGPGSVVSEQRKDH